MTDIVERLRRFRPTYGWPEESFVVVEPTMNHVAADEIERLREALREIHGLGDTPNDSWRAYQICCRALGEKE